jgi:hypothetical protein
MPRGPRGENRRADMVGCAVEVARISIGEAEDDRYMTPGRRRSGLAGGRARAEALSSDQRKEAAKKAASKRWSDGEAAD